MKIGLIIQGPLRSKGRTGRTSSIKLNALDESDIANFNCVDNIAKTFNDFKSTFAEIICVTWDDEETSLINQVQQSIGQDNVLLLKDETRQLRPKKAVVGANNKYRQFYSFLKGIELVQARGCDVVIKVRTDQYSDWDQLAQFVEKTLIASPNKVILPWAVTYSPHQIADFYIASHAMHMRELCQRYLSRPEAMDLVHRDLFYHWSFDLAGWKLPLAKLFLGKRVNFFNKKTVFNAWQQHYVIAPKKILDQLYWRGEIYEIADRAKMLFEEDVADMSTYQAKLSHYKAQKKRR
ncbi:hypothetical protein [Ferrimonas pelagia]|uniref:Uncharacterized protein n=1 Tax=Ferrimonas pelagia TaxID=1177826 RepID=A0ABP9F5X2_9GAMM